MKKFFGLVSIVILGLAISLSAGAAVFRAAGEVAVSEAINNDVYLAGGSVSVSQPIDGDLLAAGGNIVLTSAVSQDVIFAGGNVNVLGEIGDDLRVIGGTVTIAKSVKDDALVAGGLIHILPEAVIGADVVGSGGRLVIDGTVNDDVLGEFEEVVINGTVISDVDVTVSTALTLGPKAVIDGNLTYRAPKAAVVPETASVKGQVSFTPYEAGLSFDRGLLAKVFGAGALIQLVALLIAGLIAAYAFRRGVSAGLEQAYSQFWPQLLRGLVVLIVAPIAGVVLLFTLIGWPIGAAILSAFGLLLVAAKVLAVILVGAFILKLLAKDKPLEVSWQSVVVGAVVLQIIKFAPVLGWLIGLIFLLVMLGVLTATIQQKLREV